MPISGCHDLPLATFNLPSRNGSPSNRKKIPPIVIPEYPAPAGRNAARSPKTALSPNVSAKTPIPSPQRAKSPPSPAGGRKNYFCPISPISPILAL